MQHLSQVNRNFLNSVGGLPQNLGGIQGRGSGATARQGEGLQDGKRVVLNQKSTRVLHVSNHVDNSFPRNNDGISGKYRDVALRFLGQTLGKLQLDPAIGLSSMRDGDRSTCLVA